MRRRDQPTDLGAPAVPPELYDEDYFLYGCAGSTEWRESGGAEQWMLYRHYVELAAVGDGDVLVDIGTGRGELLVEAVRAGARRAVGIEYSPTAVDLARRTLAVNNIESARAEVLLADARSIPLPDDSADVVTLCDVVEHLTSHELALALHEARRILRPGGTLFAHTFPTRVIYDVTYRALWLLRGRWKGWPRDPRLEYERLMHVNEQTRIGLARALRRAGFSHVDVKHGTTVYDAFLPGERAKWLYHELARHRVTRFLAAADLFARAVAS